MGTRRLALLTALTLAPAIAFADRHPLDCLGGVTYSAAKQDEETATLATDTTNRRSRLSCTALYSEAGYQLTEAADCPPGETCPASADSHDTGVSLFPAGVVSVGSSESSEALVGALVYLPKKGPVRPLVRILPAGVTALPGKGLGWSSLLGFSLDYRSPCPKGDNILKKVCEVVRPGARFDIDGIHQWEAPNDTYVRFSLNVGLRLEMGGH